MNGTRVDRIPFKGREMPGGEHQIFAFDDTQPDGAWALDRSSGNVHLRFICPCGCRGVTFLPVDKAVDTERHTWAWDENELAPTLSPSIYRKAQCGWHGFFRAGVWETCG